MCAFSNLVSVFVKVKSHLKISSVIMTSAVSLIARLTNLKCVELKHWNSPVVSSALSSALCGLIFSEWKLAPCSEPFPTGGGAPWGEMSLGKAPSGGRTKKHRLTL